MNHAPGELVIAPSLLSADFARLGEEIGGVERAGVRWLHLDVMDGHFVPNITFGPPLVKTIRGASKSFLDAHLMITDPLKYAESFAKAGADSITFHIEAAANPRPVIERIHALGKRAGLSLNPDTPVERVLPYWKELDLVLVMSVFPGFGGQKFIPEVLEKVETLRGETGPEFDIQIDGGINPETIGDAVQAGANVVVAGSAVFGEENPGEAAKKLEEAARRSGGASQAGAQS